MDVFDKFDGALNAAETDPRPKWQKRARDLVKAGLRGLPEDVAAAALDALGTDLVAILEHRSDADPDKIFANFHVALGNAVQKAAEAARPTTPVDELKRVSAALEANRYVPIEVESIATLLAAGEKIATVEPRQIVTDRRAIARGQLIEVLKPYSSTLSRWMTQFPSEDAIRRIEMDIAKQENPPPPWSGNRNTDRG